MPKKACCCKSCCDSIFYTNFIILAGETLDDAAPVDPDDIIVLTMNRPGAGAGSPTTIFPNCSGNNNCRCVNCDWMRTYWMTDLPDGNGSYCPYQSKTQCETLWNSTFGPECGPYS